MQHKLLNLAIPNSSYRVSKLAAKIVFVEHLWAVAPIVGYLLSYVASFVLYSGVEVAACL